MLKLDQPQKLGDLIQAAARDMRLQLENLGVAEICPPVELKGGAETLISALASAEESGAGVLTFAIDSNFLEKAETAAAVIVPPELAEAAEVPAIICREPRMLFAVILGLAGSRPRVEAGEACFADRASVELGADVIISPQAYIGCNVKIGRGTVIYPQVCLEDGVEIGEDCHIHPRAVLRRGVKVGHRCQIHSGAVIGDDGFGYTQLPAPSQGRLIHFKNAHLGGVIIEDDVEIGALAAIDRGLVSDTIIGRGSKVDNLVQIGHNCRVGRDCIIVSQVGIGGHSVVGDRAFLLGQVGLGPGVDIGHDAVVTAKSGLGSGSLPPGRNLWTGIPVQRHEVAYKTQALSVAQLPRVRKFFQLLKKCASFEELKAAFFAPED